MTVDVSDASADAAEVESLARLALRLRRSGYELRLRRPSPELLELIEFVGLSGTLTVEELRPDSTGPRY